MNSQETYYQHAADTKEQLAVAKELPEEASLTLGRAEWAVHYARLTLREAAKETHWQELVVWHAAGKSCRKFNLC